MKMLESRNPDFLFDPVANISNNHACFTDEYGAESACGRTFVLAQVS